jgi:hypothetical protein
VMGVIAPLFLILKLKKKELLQSLSMMEKRNHRKMKGS